MIALISLQDTYYAFEFHRMKEFINKPHVHRNFLMLQGPATPFFDVLATHLKASKHQVHRILFCKGDEAFWSHDAIAFKEKPESFTSFLEQVLHTKKISELILFGDCRPFHRLAIEMAKLKNITVHVFEEGYVRPGWITLEKNGVNAYSRLPKDPNWYLIQNKPPKANQQQIGPSLKMRGLYDLRFQLANALNFLIYPFYRSHRPVKSKTEYIGFFRRYLTLPYLARKAKKTIDRLIYRKESFYFIPLQLDSDYQIRTHSHFSGTTKFLERVVASFASFAPHNTKLLIKKHPLDAGLINYRLVLKELSLKYNLQNRIELVDGGSLDLILRHTKGTITINSTVGLLSLQYNCPTMALGKALYNIPGLCYQNTLDDFWQQATAPNKELFQSFYNTLMHETQVEGGFYHRKAIEIAVNNCLQKLV